MPSTDDDDVSPGIEDKIKDLSINDKKVESLEQIKEESNDVKTVIYQKSGNMLNHILKIL